MDDPNTSRPESQKIPAQNEPRPKNPARGFLRALIVGTATGIILICLIVGGMIWYFWPAIFPAATPGAGENPMTYLVINQGDWKCYPDNSGQYIFEGNVLNTGPYNIWDVVVRGALLDRSGTETSSNTGYTDVRVVFPHSKNHFKVETYNEDPQNSVACNVAVVNGHFLR